MSDFVKAAASSNLVAVSRCYPGEGDTMQFKSMFPVIVTNEVIRARDFYVKHLGFYVVFEADWNVQLHAPREDGGKPIELAFMTPNLESQPAALRPAFSGEGVIVTLEVEDVDSVYRNLRDFGYEMVVDLKDESSNALVIDAIGLFTINHDSSRNTPP